MPAHWCIYKFMFYIYLIKYLFYISEYKENVNSTPNLSNIYKTKSTDKNTIKVPDR